MPRLAALLAALGLLLAVQAAAQPPAGPPSAPFLRLELGAHVAAVNRVLPLPDGQRVLTVSRDKTARLWAADGTLIRVLRPPIAAGDEGVMMAASLSPDGRTAWVAGVTGAAWAGQSVIYVFDLETGTMRSLPTGVRAAVSALAHAPDGRQVAIGFAPNRDAAGLAFADAATGRVERLDHLGITGGVTGLAFAAQGHLAVASRDEMIRLLPPGGQNVLSQRLADRAVPGDLAFSPDGRLLAVGLEDRAEVRLLETATMRPRPLPHGQVIGWPRLRLSAVAWSGSGTAVTLTAAGHVADAQGRPVALRWRDLTRPPQAIVLGVSDAVLHLAPRPRAGLAFASGAAAWGLLDAEGRSELQVAAPRLDFRHLGEGDVERRPEETLFGGATAAPGLRVSQDGMTLQFPTARGAPGVLSFSVAERTLVRLEGPPTLPLGAAGRLPLTDWSNGLTPRFAGQPLPLESGERGRAAAPLDDGGFLLGTDFGLRWYRPDGSLLRGVATPAAVWGIAVSGDRRQAVAALADGTLRWYALNPAEPLAQRAALFVHADGRRWLLWTPEGFFDHSDEGGQDLAGWHLNRGVQAADWVEFAQLHRVFYAADLVRARIGFGDETELTRRLAAIGDVRRLLDRVEPPEVSLVAVCFAEPGGGSTCRPPRGVAATRGLRRDPAVAMAAASASPAGAVLELPPGVTEIVLRAELRARRGGVGQVDLLLNGRNAGRSDTRGLARARPGAPEAQAPWLMERRVRLETGHNTLRLRAFDGANSAFGQSDLVEILVRERPQPPAPVLHVLAIGVDDYSGIAAHGVLSLGAPVADAEALERTLRERHAGGFRRVNPVLLRDADATLEGIEAAFARLAAEVQEQDTVVLFFAGHGQMEADRYLFLPYFPPNTENYNIRRLALDDRRLVQLWSALPARHSILLLDTCHAGAFTMDFVSMLQNETGRFVLAAASAQQVAADRAADSLNSPFTSEVVAAMRGEGMAAAGGVVDQLALGFRVRQRVPERAAQVGVEQRVAFRMSPGEIPLPFPLTRIGR
jgi:hypothetical protein